MLFTHWGECAVLLLCRALTHVTPTTRTEAVLTSCPCVPGLSGPVPVCLPSCFANSAFPKSRMQDFQTSWETRHPHLLSTVRAPRIVCLPKCMPVTDPKHNHSLIVLMRLQLEMSQCCHLTKEQNKHQIHLEEKKKSPWLSCEQAAGWSGFQICGVQPLISFPF